MNLEEKGQLLFLLILAVLGVALAAGGFLISSKWYFNNSAAVYTQNKLRRVALAISSKNFTGNVAYQRSFEQDVGSLPSSLSDLVSQGGHANCALSSTAQALSGWCGPYWTAPYQGESTWADGWGRTLVFDAAGRRIYSVGPNGTDENGGGDDLVQTF